MDDQAVGNIIVAFINGGFTLVAAYYAHWLMVRREAEKRHSEVPSAHTPNQNSPSVARKKDLGEFIGPWMGSTFVGLIIFIILLFMGSMVAWQAFNEGNMFAVMIMSMILGACVGFPQSLVLERFCSDRFGWWILVCIAGGFVLGISQIFLLGSMHVPQPTVWLVPCVTSGIGNQVLGFMIASRAEGP
jgi:hypothetical protein